MASWAKLPFRGKGNICPFCHILFPYLFRAGYHAHRGLPQSASGIIHVLACTPPFTGPPMAPNARCGLGEIHPYARWPRPSLVPYCVSGDAPKRGGATNSWPSWTYKYTYIVKGNLCYQNVAYSNIWRRMSMWCEDVMYLVECSNL